MFTLNNSDYENNSYTFFGPMGMAFYDDGSVLDDAYTVKIILSICLGISMVLAIIGNVCTCAVIARDKSMRSPTNCYLFNLAITDLLLSLFIPIDIYIIWIPDFYPLGEVGCRLHFVLWDCLSNCSLLIITAFTVERYIVVTKPFLRQKLSLNKRVYKIVAVIWIISSFFCIPDIFYVELLERKKYVFCYFTMTETLSILLSLETCVFFVIPMTIIFVLYLLITIELRATQTKLQNSPITGKQNRHKASKMLAAVAATFFIFWSPYCILRIMMISPQLKYEDHYNMWKIVNYLCYNGYISTAVNPVLYSLMSRKFRQAFKDFLKGHRSLNRKRIDSARNAIIRSSHCTAIKLTQIKLHNT